MPTLKLIPQPKGCDLPVIMLHIAGAKCYFLIDTGAEASIMSPSLKPSLSIWQELSAKDEIHAGFAGSTHIKVYPVKCTLIGMTIHQMTFDKSIDVLAATGFNIHGVIGQDILQQFNSVEFCWREGVVRFK